MIKQHKANEFYVKAIRGGYFGVFDGYDKSLESIEMSKEAADRLAQELNEKRNERLNHK